VNDVNDARIQLGQTRQDLQVRLKVAKNRIEDDGSSGRPNRGHFVAAVVVGDQNSFSRLELQRAKQVIDAAARHAKESLFSDFKGKGVVRSEGVGGTRAGSAPARMKRTLAPPRLGAGRQPQDEIAYRLQAVSIQ